MKSKRAAPLQSVQWLPAERLGQLPVDAGLRPWLAALSDTAVDETLQGLSGMGRS
jgi:hypothetical protein